MKFRSVLLASLTLVSCKSLDRGKRPAMDTGIVMEEAAQEAQQKEGVNARAEPTVLNLTQASNKAASAPAEAPDYIRSCTVDDACFQNIDKSTLFFCEGKSSKKDCLSDQFERSCVSTKTYASAPNGGSQRIQKIAYFYKGNSAVQARCDR